jgi:3-oxoacyl-[acyl-carrier protein] reductase
MQRFTGKTALVTGASRGIGAGIAKRLAQEGAEVAVMYGSSKDKADQVVREITSKGGKAKAFHGDLLKPLEMKDVLDRVVAHFGKLDILVNNAGIAEGGVIGADGNLTALQRTLDVNVRSVFTLTEAAVKVLPDIEGRIVNISSGLGERGIFPGVSVYALSKFAVLGMTRTWAWDLAARGITVNAVLPGPIDTDMGVPEAANLTAMKRMGSADDVAAAVAFLASSEASYVTGAELRVDGGINA